MVRQAEQEEWGHFIVRVRRTPGGTVWEIEALGSGMTAVFASPQEIVTFIRANLSPKTAGVSAPRKAEKL
jgi:hypothetical protein